MTRRNRIILFVTGLFALPVSICYAAEVGIYFDDAALTNCLPDQVSFPFATEAYVVATGAADDGGIRAWELILSWDGSLIVSPGAVSGSAINVRTFPEYMVGLAAPLTPSGSVVLARLNVFATAPGGLYVQGLGVSLPDSVPAVVFDSDESVYPLRVMYGQDDEPCATIGGNLCPDLRAPQAAPVQTRALSVTMTADVDPSPERLASKATRANAASADITFIGHIQSFEKQCLELGQKRVRGIAGPIASAMHVRLLVDEWFRGATADTVAVYVLGYDLDGCMAYAQQWGMAAESDVVVGARAFVAANSLDGTYFVSFDGAFEVLPDFTGSKAQTILPAARRLGDSSQREAADIVVDADLIGKSNGTLTYIVRRSIKGNLRGEFQIDQKAISDGRFRSGRIGERFRLYLREVDGVVAPLYGAGSILKQKGQ